MYYGYRLPLEEAIQLIHDRHQGITESELVHAMCVDQVTAQRILQALIKKGFLRAPSQRTVRTEQVYEPVR